MSSTPIALPPLDLVALQLRCAHLVATRWSERIMTMQARKAALARGLHGQAGAAATRLTEDELNWLLQPIGVPAPDLPGR